MARKWEKMARNRGENDDGIVGRIPGGVRRRRTGRRTGRKLGLRRSSEENSTQNAWKEPKNA